MRKILIVEDENRMRELLVDYFTMDGFETFEAADGSSALDIVASETLDLVLLDIMMPGIDGFTVCKRIRSSSAVPIIIITARTEEEDKILGFELGADDYVTKPFSPKVLVARCKNLLKRVDGMVGNENGILNIKNIEINLMSYEVSIDGEKLTLSPKEYELLLFLVKNKNKVMTREILLDNIWGYDYVGDLRTVDTHIKKLRNKLGDCSDYIKTIIRAGYKFEV
ncbi:MAG: response regulator transcription factor [Acidaminobacteraceae bacterium]